MTLNLKCHSCSTAQLFFLVLLMSWMADSTLITIWRLRPVTTELEYYLEITTGLVLFYDQDSREAYLGLFV